MSARFFLLTTFFTIAFCLVGVKLYSVQVKNGDYYIGKVEARLAFLESTETRRGQIFFTDRYNKKIPAALNKDYPIVYVVPKELQDKDITGTRLAEILNLSKSDLTKSFGNSESLFRLVKEKISKEEERAVIELATEGVYIDDKQYRFYPFGPLAGRLLGFVGINKDHNEPIGLYGIEKEYNATLVSENDIELSIDRNIQAQAEQTLLGLINKFDATQGTIIVEDPKTGKILTLATLPSFDPNDYKKSKVDYFVNPAVQHVYEPGSVFKPITMAAGIDIGAITPETTYNDKGSVTLNGKTIKNWDGKAHGLVTMKNVIEESINTGTVFAEQKIGHQKFTEYVKRFGFGEITEIELPDETKGSIRNLERKEAREVDFANAAFGQGTAVTPIQMISAFSSIANGGLLMRPSIMKNSEPYVVGRVIKKETAGVVTGMMQSAVEKARLAAIEGYNIAGKTGTAQIPDFKKGGYTEEYIHTYVGFGPISDPKFVILIKLDKPSAPLAGATVVPAFRNLAEYIINYYNIPPDNVVNK